MPSIQVHSPSGAEGRKEEHLLAWVAAGPYRPHIHNQCRTPNFYSSCITKFDGKDGLMQYLATFVAHQRSVVPTGAGAGEHGPAFEQQR